MRTRSVITARKSSIEPLAILDGKGFIGSVGDSLQLPVLVAGMNVAFELPFPVDQHSETRRNL